VKEYGEKVDKNSFFLMSSLYMMTRCEWDYNDIGGMFSVKKTA
jgi:hypothetical protein